jgi:hypothetical protein
MTDELSPQMRLLKCTAIAVGCTVLIFAVDLIKFHAVLEWRLFSQGPLRCLLGEPAYCIRTR